METKAIYTLSLNTAASWEKPGTSAKIQLIRVVRAHTGLPLKGSKDLVEALLDKGCVLTNTQAGALNWWLMNDNNGDQWAWVAPRPTHEVPDCTNLF